MDLKSREHLGAIEHYSRRRGNTDYLLNSAIKNPDVIILFKTMMLAKDAERRYRELLSKQPWYKKLYWRIFRRSYPKFLNIDIYNIRGRKEPVVIDLSCLI